MRTGFLALVAGLALVATSSASAAAPRVESLGVLHPTTSLAAHHLVWQPDAQTLQIHDVRARTTRAVALAPSCTLRSARHDMALVECEVPLPNGTWTCLRPHLVFLSTGEVRYIRSNERGAADGCEWWVTYHLVGRHWLEGRNRYMSPRPGRSYLRWRTGESRPAPSGVRYDPYDDPPRGDVDDPDLRPLADRSWEREGPAEVVARRDSRSPLRVRVGTRRPILLSRCRAGCRRVKLTGGRVVWKAGQTGLRAYTIATRRLWRLRVPRGFTETSAGATLIHAGDRGYLIRWP